MTVLHIHIREHDGQVRKLLESRYIDLADLHRGAQVLVRFADKLLDDAVFEEEDGGDSADRDNQHRQEKVKRNFFKDSQYGLMVQKYVQNSIQILCSG